MRVGRLDKLTLDSEILKGQNSWCLQGAVSGKGERGATGLLTLHTVFLHLLHLGNGLAQVGCEAKPVLEAGGVEDDEDFAFPARYRGQQLDPKLVICGEGGGLGSSAAPLCPTPQPPSFWYSWPRYSLYSRYEGKLNSSCSLKSLPSHLCFYSHCFCSHPTKLLWLGLSKRSKITISSAHQKTYTPHGSLCQTTSSPGHRPKLYFTLACPASRDQVGALEILVPS